MKQRATLQQVADLAQVSLGTASRALAGRGRVSEATRTRVREAAASLSFSPHTAASNFRKSRAGSVGLWLPPQVRFMDYYMNFTFGLSEALGEDEVSLSLIPHSLRPDSVDRLHVDGFVMSDVVAGDPLARAILESGKPVITSELVPDGMPAPTGSVVTDQAAAMRDSLDRLRRGGATSIVLLAPDIAQSWVDAARAGASAWARDASIRLEVITLAEVPPAADIHTLIARVLSTNEDVDAIVCAVDGVAVGVLTALHDLGVAVPDRVQLVSHVDSAAMPVVLPPIAAVDLRPREAGMLTGRMLLAELDGGLSEDERVQTLALEFHERASLRPVAEEA